MGPWPQTGTPSDREPTYIERERQRLTALLPGWHVWSVDMTTGPTSWHAMPLGAEIAVCDGNSPEELIAAVREWDADAYIKKTEAELAETHPRDGRRHEMLTAQLKAAQALRDTQPDGNI
jgi:hypothetical protein